MASIYEFDKDYVWKCKYVNKLFNFKGRTVFNRCTYYFEVPRDYTDHIDTYAAGVYSSIGYVGGFVGWQSRLSWNCSRVWCQGPRGGVQIFWKKSKSKHKYVTKNAELMKEFAWVKLRARPLEM